MNSLKSALRKNSDPFAPGCAGTELEQGPGANFDDPIIREVREIRHRLAAHFANDLGKVAQDLMKRQASHGSRLRVKPPLDRL
jgi:hypothetical protein